MATEHLTTELTFHNAPSASQACMKNKYDLIAFWEPSNEPLIIFSFDTRRLTSNRRFKLPPHLSSKLAKMFYFIVFTFLSIVLHLSCDLRLFMGKKCYLDLLRVSHQPAKILVNDLDSRKYIYFIFKEKEKWVKQFFHVSTELFTRETLDLLSSTKFPCFRHSDTLQRLISLESWPCTGVPIGTKRSKTGKVTSKNGKHWSVPDSRYCDLRSFI